MRKALLVGPAAQVRALRRLINRHSSDWRVTSARSRSIALAKLPFVNAVVAIGGPRPDSAIAVAARQLRKPLAIVWLGPDIAFIDRAYNGAAHVRAHQHRHAAFSTNIRNELRSLGIDALVLPDRFDLEGDEAERTVGRFEHFFNELKGSAPNGKRRAVVSGSSQRVASFVEAASETMPDWDFHAAIPGSRLERLGDIFSLLRAERWYRIGDRREPRMFRFAAKLLRKRRYKPAVDRKFSDSPRESRVDTETLSARQSG
jgi:hypothetical protein